MLNQKDRRKTIFAANDMILYTENPVASTKKLLEVINKFSKAVGYKKKKKLVRMWETGNTCTLPVLT